MSEPLGGKSKKEIAFELMRLLITEDETYQEELKLYSEYLTSVGVRPTTDELLGLRAVPCPSQLRSVAPRPPGRDALYPGRGGSV
jgi:hypothetical protein